MQDGGGAAGAAREGPGKREDLTGGPAAPSRQRDGESRKRAPSAAAPLEICPRISFHRSDLCPANPSGPRPALRTRVSAPPIRHCLFCGAVRATAPSDDARPRVRFAYDPGGVRAWWVCDGCGRWNLADADERLELIDALEQRVRDSGRLLAATENIALLEIGNAAVVRVGPSPLSEQAWWRYGHTLRGRHAAFRGAATRLSAATGTAIAYVGGRVGPRRRIPSYAWDDSLRTESLRWWRFGTLAWVGRSRCPFCNSVLRALEFDDAWHASLVDEEAGPALGIPCTRCDPWTPEKVFPIRGEEGALLLRRVLAYQNIAGGPAPVVERAGAAIEEAGSAEAFARRLARARTPLRRLGPVLGLALEIAMNDAAEPTISPARPASWRRRGGTRTRSPASSTSCEAGSGRGRRLRLGARGPGQSCGAGRPTES